MITPGLVSVVADDHELFRGALVALLARDFSFSRVVEAGSFDEVVPLLRSEPLIELICLDLAMPGMDGAASLHAVRESFPSVKLAVITASNRRDDILHALNAGVHGYIPKTLRISEIADALRIVLAGRIFVPPALALAVKGAQAIQDGSEAWGKVAAAKAGSTALSPRQIEVLKLMALGKSNKQIARELHLAEGTVKVHVNALFRSLGAHNRVSAVAAMSNWASPQA